MNVTAGSLNPRWEITQYDGKQITMRTVAEAEMLAIQPQQFDHYRSNSLGIYAYRNKAGIWVVHENIWPMMGPVNCDLLEAVQLHPGAYLTPAALAQVTNISSLRDNGNAAVYAHKVRLAHGNEGERFIETRRSGGLAYRWPRERTWIWIERIL